jgi:outer membrane protein assembly factor BamB
MQHHNLGLIVFLGLGVSGLQTTATDWNRNWPQWRGPLSTGVSPTATPPLEWSESKNVKWKREIPGSGTSTPIIWQDRVFLLTAIPSGPAAVEESGSTPPAEADGARRRGGGGRGARPDQAHQFVVLCLERSTGKVVWQRTAREEVPHEGHHQDHGFASASPVTDGTTLIAYFGSRGLHAYDMDGTLRWQKDFGQMTTRNSFGEGSSPALYGDTVLVLREHEGDDNYLVALDKATGDERWRVPRTRGTSWTTPLAVEHAGKAQVIISGTEAVRAYDLASGRELWSGPGLTANVVPAPVHANGVIYATSGFRGAALHAIKLGGEGRIEGTDAVLWSHNRNTPYVPSPLLANGRLYFISVNTAMISCFDAESGNAHYSAERLEVLNGIYASPVAAGDRVYVLGRNGVCAVLKNGPTLEVLATNTLDDRTDASIALVGSELFIRGHQSLYCIAE